MQQRQIKEKVEYQIDRQAMQEAFGYQSHRCPQGPIFGEVVEKHVTRPGSIRKDGIWVRVPDTAYEAMMPDTDEEHQAQWCQNNPQRIVTHARRVIKSRRDYEREERERVQAEQERVERIRARREEAAGNITVEVIGQKVMDAKKNAGRTAYSALEGMKRLRATMDEAIENFEVATSETDQYGQRAPGEDGKFPTIGRNGGYRDPMTKFARAFDDTKEAIVKHNQATKRSNNWVAMTQEEE